MEGEVSMSGSLSYRVIKCQKAPLSWRLKNTLRWAFIWGWIAYHIAPILGRFFGFATIRACLSGKVRKANGEWIDYGVLGYRYVTTVGVTAMATSFKDQANPGAFFYHAIGHTNTTENISDTLLAAEETTAYNPDSTRATGTHVSTAGVYTSVGTNTVDGSVACVEHGIFSTSASGGAGLLDRTVFSIVNLASGDSFQTTYNLTFTAGG